MAERVRDNLKEVCVLVFEVCLTPIDAGMLRKDTGFLSLSRCCARKEDRKNKKEEKERKNSMYSCSSKGTSVHTPLVREGEANQEF